MLARGRAAANAREARADAPGFAACVRGEHAAQQPPGLEREQTASLGSRRAPSSTHLCLSFPRRMDSCHPSTARCWQGRAVRQRGVAEHQQCRRSLCLWLLIGSCGRAGQLGEAGASYFLRAPWVEFALAFWLRLPNKELRRGNFYLYGHRSQGIAQHRHAAGRCHGAGRIQGTNAAAKPSIRWVSRPGRGLGVSHGAALPLPIALGSAPPASGAWG